MNEFYEGQQFVGMDLHRRRSVLVRMTETGEHLETVRIVNTRDRLVDVMSRAGEAPEVVLEATYGWYWAADALAELGASVHLAHPLGVKAFSYRRVKNDQRDAADLADLLRMGRLPHAWIASLRRFIEAFDAEIELFTGLVQRRLAHDPGCTAIQQIPGIGPVLAAVFVAEIGDVHRFDGPAKLTCWAGLTPRHHESDTTVHRGHITKQGSRLVRWAAIESVKILPATSRIGAIREQVAHRRGNRNIGAVAAARRQLELVFYGLRDHHVRALHRSPRAA